MKKKRAEIKKGIVIKVECTYLKVFDSDDEIDEVLNKIALGKFGDKDLKGWYKKITKFNAKAEKIKVEE